MLDLEGLRFTLLNHSISIYLISCTKTPENVATGFSEYGLRYDRPRLAWRDVIEMLQYLYIRNILVSIFLIIIYMIYFEISILEYDLITASI